MDFDAVMQELEGLGKERTKKMYMSNGANEPLFGVATGAMKPMVKKIKVDQPFAEKLYSTGNYDAMYFAGMIADPQGMTRADYDRWIEDAYFYMLSDYVVAVTLSESDIAEEVADAWIDSGEELKMSAGWSCYCWLLGSRKDEMFEVDKISRMLDRAETEIHDAPERAKASMNNFIYTVATSFLPLHDEAVETARRVGKVEVTRENKKPAILDAYGNIQKQVDKDRIGFKRRYVRC